MNENINLVEILKDCPRGTKLYSTTYGEVEFVAIYEYSSYPIVTRTKNNLDLAITASGKYTCKHEDAECILFPSKDQRDWSKFDASCLKKEKFDPKTLQPYDKVIARLHQGIWCCELFSFIEKNTNLVKCCGAYYAQCVPYDDDTKHLIGTTNEAPEYYRYWD